MKITIVAVGKLKESYLREACSYYTAQICSRCEIKIIEIPDESIPDNASQHFCEIIKDTEGSNILGKIAKSQYVIALAIEGKKLNTYQFKTVIDNAVSFGRDDFVFVIGGSLGLSQQVLNRADFKLSFSPMTFPHQLMRIMLLEQINTVLTL